jgi:hypothetical protein
MINASDKSCTEKTRILCLVHFFENHACMRKFGKNKGEPETQTTDDNIIRRRKGAISMPVN